MGDEQAEEQTQHDHPSELHNDHLVVITSSERDGNDDEEEEEESSIVEKELERIGVGVFHLKAAIILGLGNAADAVEVLAISFVLPHIPDTSDSEKGFLSSSFFVGMLLGGLVCGLLSDHVGRKPCLIASLFLNSLFGLLSAVSPNFPLLFLCRLIAGIGVGGSVPSVFTMATEFMPKHGRGVFVTVIAWWWMIGAVYTAGTAWLMMGIWRLHWKIFLAFCSVPAALCTLFSWISLPETPRYYYARKNFDKVLDVLSEMSRQNGKMATQVSVTELVAEVASIENKSKTLKEAEVRKKNEGEPKAQSKQKHKRRLGAATEEKKKLIENAEGEESRTETTGFRERVEGDDKGEDIGIARQSTVEKQQDEVEARGNQPEERTTTRREIERLVKRTAREISYLFHPDLLRVTVLLCLVWFTLNFGWYGLVSWTPTLFHNSNNNNNAHNSTEPTPTPDPDSVDVYRDTFLSQAANLPGNIISSLLVDRLGRKWLLVCSMLGSGLVAGLLSLLLWQGTSQGVVVALACLFNGISVGGWNSLDVLSAESFPTVLRTTAMGVLAAVGRIGSVVAQIVYAQLISDRLPELLFLSALVMLAGGFCSIFLSGDRTSKNLSDTVR
eukprot:TRINITY_DN1900_c0_g2_i1.p1 TRINITY_DN1900_c0_g2~~TRINITY_DN1900_c0_g2_i1.p1  ORF type:complete len:613 (-),score=96.30 TRINITY_DN1900_c0_g2_i1:737-2575(-)